MAFLRYLDESGQLQIKTIDTEHFAIGRAPTCQLILADDMISREHLRIDLESEGRFRIRDLGSRNKTYINGELTTDTLLTSGDIIRVGDHVFEYLDGESVPERVDLEFVAADRTEPPHCDWIKLKAPVSLTIRQVELLSQLSSDQPLTARAEDIANASLGEMVLNLQAERGLIALRGENKTDLRPLAHRAFKRSAGGPIAHVNQPFLLAPVLQNVAGRYPQTTGQVNTKLDYATTAIVAPLTFRGETIGVLYLDRPASKRPFTSANLQYCLAAGAQIGAMLAASARKLARSAAREGAAWMTAIRRTHAALSNDVTSSDGFEAVMKIYPGRARCGDFGDVIHVDEQRCCAVIIDGGGRGITGIAQASAIRMAIRAAVSVSDEAVMDPSGVFTAINQMIAHQHTRQIIPCTFVGIDMSAGKLVYINAGGPPPLLMVAPGRLVTLDQASLVVGVDPDYLHEGTRVDLPEVFRLVCHTDGLTESSSASGEPLGDQRLHEVLLDPDTFGSAGDVLARVGNAWTTHLAGAHPDDDALALVVARG